MAHGSRIRGSIGHMGLLIGYVIYEAAVCTLKASTI